MEILFFLFLYFLLLFRLRLSVCLKDFGEEYREFVFLKDLSDLIDLVDLQDLATETVVNLDWLSVKFRSKEETELADLTLTVQAGQFRAEFFLSTPSLV